VIEKYHTAVIIRTRLLFERFRRFELNFRLLKWN